jgi:hypothetical protein
MGECKPEAVGRLRSSAGLHPPGEQDSGVAELGRQAATCVKRVLGDMHSQLNSRAQGQRLNGSRRALPLDCAAVTGKRHDPKSTA